MINSVGKDCCICRNCINSCPRGAITLSDYRHLFLYPCVDSAKCISCNLCEETCPALNSLEKQTIVRSFAARNKNKEEVLHSSSGGLFCLLAKEVLGKGGTVYGAAWTKDLKVEHIAINTFNDVEKLMGSKYVLSNIGNTVSKIMDQLQHGETVMFTGTPCQCAAVRLFTSKKPYNGRLYLVDFVCHGILSEKLFSDYKAFLEKKHHSRIVSFEFRSKEKLGWNQSGPKIIYENGEIDCWPLAEDLYMRGYFDALCMNEACYSCKYKDMHDGSDLTLGDYWGAELIDEDFYDKDGNEICVIKTNNGEELFNSIKEQIFYKETDIEVLTKYNSGFYKPFSKSKKYDCFFDTADRIGTINALIKLRTKQSVLRKIYRIIKKTLNKRKMV